MEDFYKGYVLTRNKKAITPFKDVSSKDLLTLEDANKYPEYAGVLDDDAVLIDIDDGEQAEILLNIIKSKAIKCRAIATTRGCHFLFWNNGEITRNRTHCKLAIGLTADIKGCGKASYEVLKYDGVKRTVLYDTETYEPVPKWLEPIKSNVQLLNMVEGQGRNNALFSFILPLQQNEFSIDECRECIGIINDFILKEPLPEEELKTILRDGAFNKPTFFTSKGGFLFDKFAKYIQKAHNIVKINDVLHIYKDGYYQAADEFLEAAMIAEIPNLNQSKRKEVLAYLPLITKKVTTVADAHLVAFKNGVLNVVTNEFYDLSPEYIITNMIPHNYNPDAQSELLDKTMRKLACNDESVLKLLYQAVAYNFYRRNELRKSFFLLGEKRNGKSTFLDMIQTLLGEDNVANLDLCDIGHPFKTAELTNKLANIGDDISDEWIANTAIFKKVVSGDVVTVEKKFANPFKLRSFTKFFFSANALPRLGRGKDSGAVMDRLVVIPFDAKFSKQDPDYDPFIKYKLREEAVMEALIAKAIPALQEVLANQEFETCDKIKESLDEFEKTNNPILDFFDELIENDYIRAATKDVYRQYSIYCVTNNLQPISALEFNRQMKNHFDLTVKETTVDKKRVRIFVKE